MKYKISISEDKTYLKVKVFDPITGEMEKEFAEKAIKDGREYNINRFLVDVRGTQNIAGSIDQYFFGYKDVDNFGVEKNSKIAIIVDPEDSSHDFIEMILVNAGYVCRIMHDEDPALKWLKK